MSNHRIKQTIQWFIAIAISIVILNCIVAFYALSPGFLHRDGGPTKGVWIPGMCFLWEILSLMEFRSMWINDIFHCLTVNYRI